MDYVKALADTFLFRNMPRTELEKLAKAAKTTGLQAHGQLFREGDDAKAMYVIALGSVRVSKRDTDGEDEEIATLGTGSYIGEMALVSDNHVRTATIVAKEPTTLIEIDRGAVEKACDSDHTLAYHFYYAIARGVARRLNATTLDAAHYRALYKHEKGV